MKDEEKVGIVARLAKEVLGSALEVTSGLSLACRSAVSTNAQKDVRSINVQKYESATNVLSDTFAVLTSPWCRVGRTSTGDENQDDNDHAGLSATTAQLAVVKGRLLSKISRKHLIETIVPILCNLKTVLESNRSALLKDLMIYLVEIFRRYKGEVKELLATDPSLLSELEFDMRQFEKKQKETPGKKKSKGTPCINTENTFKQANT